VETLLATLVESENADELATNWQRLAEHFDTLFSGALTSTAGIGNGGGEWAIDRLKDTILQLAVMGKLVPQNPDDEPASELLKKIETEKAKLVKEGKIKKQKPLPEITDEEKPFELPQGWELVSLGSLVVKMDAGWSPACPPHPARDTETWGVLKTTAVQKMQYLEQENKELPDTKEPRPVYEVKTGDILITRAGPKNRVGISCLVKNTRPRLMISDKIIRFHLASPATCGEYITLCLNAGSTADYLENSKSGMAESQMNISQGKLLVAPIALPSLAEQHRIIAKVDELCALCDKLKARLQAASETQLTLTEALVEQALR
jgi:type I restriction enzyme S subunit